MANNYWVNDRRLDDAQGRWLVMEGTKVPPTGSMRLVSTQIPGRMGVVPQPIMSAEPFQVAINMMVTDAPRAGSWAQLQANWDALMAIVRPFSKLCSLQYKPDGGGIRWAPARLLGGVVPEFDRGAMAYDATLVFEIPGGVWKDPNEVVMPVNDLSRIRGGSAPIQDAKFLVANPPGLISVRDYTSGTQMSWTGSAPPGKSLLLEPGEYKASYVNPGTWEHSGNDASYGMDISAFGFSMYPDHEGVYLMQATGGTWQVKAARSYA